MSENSPLFDASARIIRILRKEPKKVVMSDGTFRVYYPSYVPGEPGIEHFAFGTVSEKTDIEILSEMTQLLCGSGTQYYHEDGTPHK